MSQSSQPWFYEFTVTPAIQHAVEVLRMALPSNADSLFVGLGENGMEADIALTEQQEMAAAALMTAAGLHQAAIRQAFGLSEEDDSHSYPECRAVLDHLATQIRGALSIEADCYCYNGQISGTVSVYR